MHIIKMTENELDKNKSLIIEQHATTFYEVLFYKSTYLSAPTLACI